MLMGGMVTPTIALGKKLGLFDALGAVGFFAFDILFLQNIINFYNFKILQNIHIIPSKEYHVIVFFSFR